MEAPLETADIERELSPYGLDLKAEALGKLSCYLDILMRWNQRINLTAIREPRRAIRELFGESLFLSRVIPLSGHLVDVGTGGGFPGLALKIAAPELRVTLIESDRRKCAFLKEVARECGFSEVQVVSERFEVWLAARSGQKADIITTRAVDSTPRFLDTLAGAADCGGIFTTTDVVKKLKQECGCWVWEGSSAIPNGSNRVILYGKPTM